MSKARTIEWASVAAWWAEHEQQLRDVFKFEGLKGTAVEVLRLAPDQPELAALREELAAVVMNLKFAEEGSLSFAEEADLLQQRLADAERRNAELVELLREVVELPGARSFRPRALWSKVDAALTKPEEAKS